MLSLDGQASHIKGDLLALSADSAWVLEHTDPYARRAVSRASIRLVESHHETIPAGREALGVGVGGVVGGALWVIHFRRDSCKDGPCGLGIIVTPAAVILGAVLGGVAGRASAHDTWTVVDLPPE